MIQTISSLSNEKIKQAASLKEKKYRDGLGLFSAEGIRFSEMAAASDFEIVSAFFEKKILENKRGENLISALEGKSTKLFEVNESIMKKISNVKTSQGIFIVLKKKAYSVDDLKASKNFAVLDNLRDPGNMGTIIRLCDAVGAGAAMLTKNCVDPYSDKVLRATMGSVFNVPIIENLDVLSLKNFATERNLKIYATKTDAPACYEEDFKEGGVFVFGNESEGVGEEILNVAKSVSLPMAGKAESLNAATAAAALLYEVYRQQNY